jgi:NAD(P)-dependent dehydrogenase (short-subunit alcohol dehydrogenase family)
VRILVVGASGVLGNAVVAALAGHEIIEASRNGQRRVDLKEPASIAELYAGSGELDAVACAAGVTPFRPFAELALEDYRAGLEDKLLGQIELVRQGVGHVRDGGSFTLVSGILSAEPIETGTVASTVNGGVDAFVRAASTGLPRGQRINSISANAFVETWDDYAEFFPGFTPVPVADVGRAFARSVLGVQTGQVYRVGY